jgi:hypothetical protein
MVEFHNRIVELRRVRASELRRHPKNWRQHPEGQRSALTELLTEIVAKRWGAAINFRRPGYMKQGDTVAGVPAVRRQSSLAKR